MKMEQTECSETSAYKIKTPGNDQKERIQHSKHGGSLKPRMIGPFLKLPFLSRRTSVYLQKATLLNKVTAAQPMCGVKKDGVFSPETLLQLF